MPETKNALAELAEVMDKPVDMASIHDRGLFVLNAQQFSAYQKAQRIIAELAKVSEWHWQVICDDFCTTGDFELHCTIGRCLAIAEEGVKDGK